MQRLFFFVPPSGNIGFWSTIFSFDGKFGVALSADNSIVSEEDGAKITTEYFYEALVELEQAFIRSEPTVSE